MRMEERIGSWVDSVRPQGMIATMTVARRGESWTGEGNEGHKVVSVEGLRQGNAITKGGWKRVMSAKLSASSPYRTRLL